MDTAQLKERLKAPAQMSALLGKRKASYEERVASLEADKVALIRAQVLLDQAISRVSEGGIARIEQIVTDGLRFVFPDMDLKFVVDKKTGAKGSTYKFLVEDAGVRGKVEDTVGGGVVNVTQFLLRVIMIQRFGLRKFLALDESFNNVSEDYLFNVSTLLKSLCEDQGFKILLVTHQEQLAAAADRVYKAVDSDTEGGPDLVLLEQEELDDLRSGSGEIGRRG